jgi:hypothetical protein
MSLPANAHNCLVEWYASTHAGVLPPVKAWELTQDSQGLRISKWNIADAQPDDATINSFAATADAFVRSTVLGDTEQWSKEFRCVLKVIFNLAKIITPSLTAAQFKSQVKQVWDSL